MKSLKKECHVKMIEKIDELRKKFKQQLTHFFEKKKHEKFFMT